MRVHLKLRTARASSVRYGGVGAAALAGCAALGKLAPWRWWLRRERKRVLVMWTGPRSPGVGKPFRKRWGGAWYAYRDEII